MAEAAESFGMMSAAYFVGKRELIEWVNNTLQLSIKKVEDCAGGAVYAQLVDYTLGKIPMSKLDFGAKYEHDYVKNYKILQESFEKHQIQKVIPVDRLIKARYQDNLEFLQWMYQWSQRVLGGAEDVEYNARGRRGRSKGGKTFIFNATNGSAPASDRRARPAQRSTLPRVANSSRAAASPKPARARTLAPSAVSGRRPGGAAKAKKEKAEMTEELSNVRSDLSESQSQLRESQSQIEKLTVVAKDLERERDFYYGKIVKVEELLKKKEFSESPISVTILEILYEAEDDDGDNGNAGDDSMNDVVLSQGETVKETKEVEAGAIETMLASKVPDSPMKEDAMTDADLLLEDDSLLNDSEMVF